MSEDNEVAILKSRLDEHLSKHDLLIKELDDRIERVIRAQELNATNIAHLTESTQGVVDAWVVANGLHRFIKWISAFGIVVGVGVWLKDFIK